MIFAVFVAVDTLAEFIVAKKFVILETVVPVREVCPDHVLAARQRLFRIAQRKFHLAETLAAKRFARITFAWRC